MRYHSCIVQYFTYNHPELKKSTEVRIDPTNNQEFNIIGKNSQQLSSSGAYLQIAKIV
jgi:hypothetical protein